MPRKGSVPKRDVLPDPVYHSKTVTKFINKVMLSGKKSVAERVVYDAFETIRAKTGKDPLEVLRLLSRTLCRFSRFAHAASVVLTTRFRSRSVRTAA